ncbi:MAG: DUF2066 domain-containing protein [Magnetococcales bacterium]|nr:DUF2066 domain-containing protein [Magnetococcales bacterium]MBF0323243.1 DUF2066 domain-containing protein [Magnetococcales bacterium]
MIQFFRRAGWISIVWFLCVSWPALALAESVYLVKGVEVVLPPTDEKGRDPQATGMAMAKEQAWHSLQARMLTSEDRSRHADRLRELKTGLDTLIERVVVQAEKRVVEGVNTRLHMVLDVTFSRDAVRKVFDAVGFTYNENTYPPTLFLMAQVEGSGEERLADPGQSFAKAVQAAAARYGVTVLEPMGDIEDITNLALKRVTERDPALWSWAESRYGTQRIWTAWYGMESPQEAASGSLPSAIATLVESDITGELRRIRLRARKGCGPADGHGLQNCLDGPLATKFVEMILDNWGQGHAVKPELNHAVPLRVIHDRQLAGYAEFVKKLAKVPGVAAMRTAAMTARDVLLILDFQGQDDKLLESLTGMGSRPERTRNELTVHMP